MKLFLIYIIIIGISLVCLFVVLEMGKGEQAPVNVAGEWIIREDLPDSSNKSCFPFRFNPKRSKIIIEQSGIYFTLYFTDSFEFQMQGKMENNKIFFSKIFPVKKGLHKYCAEDIKLELSLTLIRHRNKPPELSGRLVNRNCKECKEIRFTSFRIHNEGEEE